MIIQVTAAAQRSVTLAERGACDCVDERGACDRPTCATVQSGAMHLNANCVQLEVKEARLDPTSRFWSFLALDHQ